MKKKWCIFVVSILVLIVFIDFRCKGNKEILIDALRFKEEYESINGQVLPNIEIDSGNPIKYSNESEIEDIIKSGTGIIYFGYPTCPWCRNAVPVLLQAASDAGIDTIYYLNVYEERDTYTLSEDGELILEKKGTDDYQKLLELLDEYLDEYHIEDDEGNKIDTLEKRIYVPFVVFVRDGEILGTHSDTVDSQDDPYEFLNNDQYEELYSIYTSYIHKVLNDVCDERC